MPFSIPTAYAGVITDAPSVASLGYNALEFLLTAAGILMVVAFIISGIMFLLAQGDYRALDKAKKSMSYSVIGVVIVLAALMIVRTLGSVFKGNI